RPDYWRQLRIGMKHQNHIAILVTLVIVNASWSLLNKWQFSKHKILAAATARPGFAVNRLMGDQQRTSGSSLTPTVTADDELDSWEKLYEEYDAANGKELRLRFLPDSDDQASDALLLICYGYKLIRKIDAIPCVNPLRGTKPCSLIECTPLEID